MLEVSTSDFAAFVYKYMIGKPRVTGLLISPEALQSTGITVNDLLRERIP
jgi:hypothetical protein